MLIKYSMLVYLCSHTKKLIKYTKIYAKCTIHVSVVHGEWSSWTKGECSKSCGGGIVRFNRTCNNPMPSCGGLSCRGINVHEEACNEHCCRGKIIIVSYVCKWFWMLMKCSVLV